MKMLTTKLLTTTGWAVLLLNVTFSNTPSAHAQNTVVSAEWFCQGIHTQTVEQNKPAIIAGHVDHYGILLAPIEYYSPDPVQVWKNTIRPKQQGILEDDRVIVKAVGNDKYELDFMLGACKKIIEAAACITKSKNGKKAFVFDGKNYPSNAECHNAIAPAAHSWLRNSLVLIKAFPDSSYEILKMMEQTAL